LSRLWDLLGFRTDRRQIVSGGILGYAKEQTQDGIFTEIINGETYYFEVKNFANDGTYTVNATLGSSSSVNTRMVIAHYHGNLTINSGVKLTAVANSSGYCGPKGLFICVDGTLTNNGEISMTARGASAAGQDVFICQNKDKSWEYVPAIGGNGGTGVINQVDSTNPNITRYMYGGHGVSGLNRGTGGGGGGSTYIVKSTANYVHAISKRGGHGTSYSGGPGGGGASAQNINGDLTHVATPGSDTGGLGGEGNAQRRTTTHSMSAGGGAGNPGGYNFLNGSANGRTNSGTGGLLIVYAKNIVGIGTFTSKGSNVTSGLAGGGGNSGGGSVNVLGERIHITSSPSASNWCAGGSAGNGGAGGDGSLIFTKILLS